MIVSGPVCLVKDNARIKEIQNVCKYSTFEKAWAAACKCKELLIKDGIVIEGYPTNEQMLEYKKNEKKIHQAEENSNFGNGVKVRKAKGNWKREEAENHPRTLYIFTDNTDRNSGSEEIEDNSWYAKKYGKGLHYPKATAAVVRGLDNARPISTMHYFYRDHNYAHPLQNRKSKALWHDSDLEEFTKIIREELQDIKDAMESGNYDNVVFPGGDGLFNSKLSNITKERTPKLYEALKDLLQEFGFDSMIPVEEEVSEATEEEEYDGPYVENNVAEGYSLHSGGAKGSDSYWDEIGAKYGFNEPQHYYRGSKTSLGNVEQSDEDYKEGEKKMIQAADDIGRAVPADKKTRNLQIRNWNQVKYADSIFAIGHILHEGDVNSKNYEVTNTQVDGGTGYAVQMAINEHKPVYVFDQEQGKWFEYSYEKEDFVETETPTLTKNYAGIGTSEINESGKKAIRDVYEKTFGGRPKPIEKSTYEAEYEGRMDKWYRGNSRKEVKSKRTIDAIINGERTATTRYTDQRGFQYWKKNAKKGNIIRFHTEDNSKEVFVRVTRSIHPLNNIEWTKDTKEIWSKKEGWSVKYFETEVLPKIDKAYQFEYELISGEELKELEEEQKRINETRHNTSFEKEDNATEKFLKANLAFSAEERTDRVDMLAEDFINYAEEVLEEEIENIANQIQEIESKKGKRTKKDRALLREARIKQNLYNSETGLVHMLADGGLELVINKMQENYKELISDAEEEGDKHSVEAYTKILENFDVLFDEACGVLEDNRIVSIEYDALNSNNSIISENTEEEDTSEETDTLSENTDNAVSGNDGFNFKVRNLDSYSLLSKRIKQLLGNINRIKENGEQDINDLGRIRHMKSYDVHETLLSLMQDVSSSDDFAIKDENGEWQFPMFQKHMKQYPWLQQIVDMLQNNDDQSLIALFYTDLRQDFIKYSQQVYMKEKKGIGTKDCNSMNKVECAIDEISDNYTQGIILHPDSIYTETSLKNVKGAEKGKELVSELREMMKDDVEGNKEGIIQGIDTCLRMIGLMPVRSTIEEVVNQAIDYINEEDGVEVNPLDILFKKLSSVFAKVTTLGQREVDFMSEFKGFYKDIAQIVGTVKEGKSTSVSRIAGDNYYSYSSPNWINTLVKNINNEVKALQFLEEEYGYDSWFSTAKGFREGWIKMLSDPKNGKELRKNFDITHELTIQHGNKEYKYKDWTPSIIREGFFRRYWSIPRNNGSKYQYAWYGTPILADSPMCIMLKFVKFENYKEELIPRLAEVAMQEYDRITRVRNRHARGVQPIQNYDITEKGPSRGNEFCFFPELNSEENKAIIESFREKGDTKGLRRWLEKTAIPQIMTDICKNNMLNMTSNDKINFANILIQEDLIDRKSVVSKDAKGHEYMDVEKCEKVITPFVNEYMWNSTYANTQIIQMTVTDLAFYKNSTDFQKRFKEIYAAGKKLFTNMPLEGYPNGKKVRRSIYLTDCVITSPSFMNAKAALDEAVDKGYIKDFDRDAILDKLKNINAADAQAYVSPQALREMLMMMGTWDESTMGPALDHFEKGKWDAGDFNVLWQTIKPFLFTQVATPDGLGGRMRVGHQNKNSEFVLLAFYGLVANSFSASPQLRALQKFMRDNQIDVIQFESAVKTGGQGIVDITYSQENLNNFIDKQIDDKLLKKLKQYIITDDSKSIENIKNFEEFKKGMDKCLENGDITQKEYNTIMDKISPDEQQTINILNNMAKIQPEEAERAATGEFGFKEDGSPRGVNDFKETVVHELKYEDLVIQQPTKEHLFDAESIYGSQHRNLIISDLPTNFNMKIDGRNLNKEETVDLYNFLQIQNLLEDFRELEKDLGSIEKVQKLLRKSIKASDKFNRDMLDAIEIVTIKDEDGRKRKVFNLPLNNPNTTIKLQEIVTSLFASRVTKQHIKGGACFLVSNFGLTRKLNVLYNEDHSLKGIECYLPASSKDFYEPFMKYDKNGNPYLDVEELPEELRRGVGYRIPTEDKYSMVPLIIKGFLPQQNGSSIMLPADIVALAGSDFDIDKLFIMLPEFKIEKFNKEAAKEYYIENVLSEEEKEDLEKDSSIDITKTKEFKSWYKDNKNDFRHEKPIISKIKYDINASKDVVDSIFNQTGKPKEQRAKRNNMIIDLCFGILTAKGMEDKILNPGNFDKLKVHAGISDIIANPEAVEAFKDFCNVDNNDDLIDIIQNIQNTNDKKGILKKFKKNNPRFFSEGTNPLTVDTFIYNHVQNMTGGKLISIYAINGSMHAKYQHSRLAISDAYTFTFDGNNYKSLHNMNDKKGNRISSNNAQFQAASVDNVKDPVLAKLMQNENTAFIAGFMVRAGMPLADIAMFFSQPEVKAYIKSGEYMTGFSDYVKSLRSVDPDLDMSSDYLHNVTSRDLLECALSRGLQGSEKQKSYDVLRLFAHIVELANDLNDITKNSRMDSPNGSISNTISGAQVQINNVQFMNDSAFNSKFTGLESTVQNDYIKASMSNQEIIQKLRGKELPLLQAFYSLGIEFSKGALTYFPQVNDMSDAFITYVMKNAPEYYHRNSTAAQECVERLYKAIIEFELSQTKLFGEETIDGKKYTFAQKREYYLSQFVKDFKDIKQKLKKGGLPKELSQLRKLNVIQKLTVTDSGKIIIPKSARMRKRSSDMLRREMEMMLAIGGDVAKLAKQLFLYSYYAEGFWFGPETINNIFGTGFITQFPEFVNTLRNMKQSMASNSYWEKFLPQFYANNPEETNLLTNYMQEDEYGVKRPRIRFSKNVAHVNIEDVARVRLDNKTGEVKIEVFDYIRIKKGKFNPEKLYKAVAVNDDIVDYMEVPTIDNKGQYNAGMDIDELKQYDTEIKNLVKPKHKKEKEDEGIKKTAETTQENSGTQDQTNDINIPTFNEDTLEDPSYSESKAKEVNNTIDNISAEPRPLKPEQQKWLALVLAYNKAGGEFGENGTIPTVESMQKFLKLQNTDDSILHDKIDEKTCRP